MGFRCWRALASPFLGRPNQFEWLHCQGIRQPFDCPDRGGHPSKLDQADLIPAQLGVVGELLLGPATGDALLPNHESERSLEAAPASRSGGHAPKGSGLYSVRLTNLLVRLFRS